MLLAAAAAAAAAVDVDVDEVDGVGECCWAEQTATTTLVVCYLQRTTPFLTDERTHALGLLLNKEL